MDQKKTRVFISLILRHKPDVIYFCDECNDKSVYVQR